MREPTLGDAPRASTTPAPAFRALLGSPRALLAVVVALAFAVRAVFLARPGVYWVFNDDSDYYLALARGLAGGCGFAPLYGQCGPPEVVRTPGYPAFLVPFLAHLRAVILVQAALGAVACLLVARFAAGRYGARAAVIAAVFVAADVPTILVTKEIMSEALFQCLAAGAVVVALRRRGALWGALCGALLGAGVLVRPVGAVLIPVSVGALLRHRQWRGAFSALAVSTLVVLGWAARNDRRAGILTVTTEGAASLYTLTAPGIVARRSGAPFQAVQDSFRLAGEQRFRAVHGDTTYWGSAALPAGSRFMLAAALPIIVGHPIDAVAITLTGFAEIAFRPYVLETGWQGFIRRRPVFEAVRSVSTAVQCALLVLLWTGVARAATRARDDADRWALLAAGVLLILAASPFPGNTSVRFRSPAMPFLAVLAGAGWGVTRRPGAGRLDHA